MIRFFILVIVSLIGSAAICQDQSTPLLFTYEIESQFAQEKLKHYQVSAKYSFIGDYYNTMMYSDISVSWGVDTLDLLSYEVGDALPHVIDASKDSRIVIISESHSKPQHRIFSKQLILALAEHGFDHLGMEALTSDVKNENNLHDTLLEERGYPLNSRITGHYIREPQMASLLRGAIDSDYRIFAYERGEGQKKDRSKDRDEVQADNVINYLSKNPNAKTILHCGWHHAIESDSYKNPKKKTRWLAWHIKNKTGIEPLTIYQDNFTEKKKYNSHPILSECKVESPSVFIDKNGEIPRLSKHVDIEILHPITQYIDTTPNIENRPSWLYQDENYRNYVVDLQSLEIDYPLFIKAFIPGEEKDGVPVDIVEIKHRFRNQPLVLFPGQYVLEITNKVESIWRDITIE